MAQRLAIIDYGAGELHVLEKALERAARESGLAAAISVTDDPDKIGAADCLVLIGAGAFGAVMTALAARDGILEAMEHAVLVEARPFLGVGAGMQLLADRGPSPDACDGLGWIAGEVVPVRAKGPTIQSPHARWRDIVAHSPHPLFAGIENEAFYFACAHRFVVENDLHVIAVVQPGGETVAAIARDNIAGVQFDPDKSRGAGAALLKNLLAWNPV